MLNQAQHRRIYAWASGSEMTDSSDQTPDHTEVEAEVFYLDSDAFDRLLARLERPAQLNPRLAALLAAQRPEL